MSVKPALALKAAEVAQDPEDQGVAGADQGKVEEVGAEDDDFRQRQPDISAGIHPGYNLVERFFTRSAPLSCA
jgi:hypothetical protein